MRPTPTALTLECHRVDLHFSIDLMTSNRTDAIVDDLLRHRVLLADPDMWVLRRADMVVFGSIHFYKEAIARGEVNRLKDLVLYKLVDVLALVSDPDDPIGTDRLVERVRELGQERAVFYTLSAVDTLFPGKLDRALLAALAPASSDYLDEVVDESGRVYRWQKPLLARFFDPRRMTELAVLMEDA
jgi:hypothetical protein